MHIEWAWGEDLPVPWHDVAAMLEDLLKNKVIELPECKWLEEINWVNNSKYCKYHRVVNHSIGNCFVIKELSMKLNQEGKIELDFEEVATANMTSVVFEPLNHVALPNFDIWSLDQFNIWCFCVWPP